MFWSTRIRLAIASVIFLSSCSEQKAVSTKTFYNIDSLVNSQVQSLGNHELVKTVEINGKQEQTRFVPDSLQWTNELDIFMQIDQVNKASFRDAYIVSDSRDTNSNLTLREIKAQRETPVPLMRLYYLNTPSDLWRVEATLQEENALYVNERKMVLEFEGQKLHRYSIEGVQKMVMDDSVKFAIRGQIE
jgi:hypothetical protein